MNIYTKYVLPRLIDLAMRNKASKAERLKLVPLATGKTLEVGIGSGLNIPLYSRNVTRLLGVDPSSELWKLAPRRAEAAPFRIEFVKGSAENLPLDDETVDTVVTTWTLCSIPDPALALSEMRRVLRPGGKLLFIEHGRSPDARVVRWQDRLNPLWRRLAGGCNLNRRIDDLITSSGFSMTEVQRGYAPGPKPLAYLYRGLAVPRREPQ